MSPLMADVRVRAARGKSPLMQRPPAMTAVGRVLAQRLWNEHLMAQGLIRKKPTMREAEARWFIAERNPVGYRLVEGMSPDRRPGYKIERPEVIPIVRIAITPRPAADDARAR